jgi:hypothetical protein
MTPILVELLQDSEADLLVELPVLERFGEGHDDDLRRQRIAIGFEFRRAYQMPDTTIERIELVVAEVLDDARDVADDDRLVHRHRVYQRQIGGIDLREVRLWLGPAGDTVFDVDAQPPLELGDQRRPATDERAPGVEIKRLLLAHVGPAGSVHQHVADLVQHFAEREQQPVDRQVAAIAQDPRGFPRRMSGRRFGGQRVHECKAVTFKRLKARKFAPPRTRRAAKPHRS